MFLKRLQRIVIIKFKSKFTLTQGKVNQALNNWALDDKLWRSEIWRVLFCCMANPGFRIGLSGHAYPTLYRIELSECDSIVLLD